MPYNRIRGQNDCVCNRFIINRKAGFFERRSDVAMPGLEARELLNKFVGAQLLSGDGARLGDCDRCQNEGEF